MTLFVAFAALILPVCALGLAGRSWRVSAALVAVLLAVAYWGGSELLGRAKPARLALMERGADDVAVVGSYYIEDVAIWLWLILPGDDAPRAYALPWSLEMAKKLTRVKREAGEAGTTMRIKLPFKAAGLPEVYAPPQPPMPEKTGE